MNQKYMSVRDIIMCAAEVKCDFSDLNELVIVDAAVCKLPSFLLQWLFHLQSMTHHGLATQ
jgi:hypothetical protein